MTLWLVSVALLLLLQLSVVTAASDTHITIVVKNSVKSAPIKTYHTYLAYRGILLGGMRRLQNSNEDFTFTYTENPDYGPYLVSVNGLARNEKERTYWELLVKKENGTIIRTNVGIGCYIPIKDDTVILNYNKYNGSAVSGN